MRKSVPVALVLVAVIIATWVMPVQADGYDAINNLIASDKISNDEVYAVYIDMANSPQGTVASTVYQTIYQTATIQTHSILAQPYGGEGGAKDKLSRFFLYLGNNNKDMIMGLKGATPDELVAGYVYGPRKTEIIDSYINGIVDCLGNPALWTGGTGGSSNFTTPAKTGETTPKNPDSWAEKYLATTFTVDTETYSVVNTGTSNPGTTTPEIKTMDVKPYIKNDRTYVPVRYLAYSLGVPENGVTWNSKAQSIGIIKENTRIGLTIGNDIMTVNGKSKFMDVAPEITSGRTMLPARWVAEALGAEVVWDDKTKQAVIKIPVDKPGN